MTARFQLSRSRMRFIVVTAVVIIVSGCASPADPNRMTLTSPQDNNRFPEQLYRKMCVRTVSGGKKTNPLWMSDVSSEDFQSALSDSMRQAGLLATTDPCRFPVDVNLLGLSKPMFGISMTVTSHVNYKVFDEAGQPILLETITAPYTAKASDAMVGIVRMRLANEGAIRSSISQFFDQLRAAELPSSVP